jgi:hypothetical protein
MAQSVKCTTYSSVLIFPPPTSSISRSAHEPRMDFWRSGTALSTMLETEHM